MDQFSKEPVL